MKIILYSFTLIFFTHNLYSQEFEAATEKARFLIKAHQQQTHLPGVQVALLVKDSLVWSEGFGYSDLEKKIPVDSQTKFRVASISKSISSIALGKLMDDSLIDIDQEIHTYLPSFPQKEHPINSRQLAASTAGIRHYESKDPTYNTVNYSSIESSLDRFKDDPLLFEPGTEYYYSSYSWVLLSAVMEKTANKPFFEIMEQTWSDLGMQNTTFDYPNSEIENKSKFYIHDKKENRIIAPEDNRSYMYAGGGYLSTAENLVKMGSEIVNPNYLEKSTIKELTQSYELKDGTKTLYGLGWETGQSRLGTKIIYHSGNMSTARSHLIIYPEKEIVFAYIANSGDQVFFNDREAQNIAELFVEALEEPSEVENKSIFIGKWDIVTSSLRNKKSKGTLDLKNKNGIICGELSFTRSRKKKTFPVVLAQTDGTDAHLIAVSPMFIDFYLSFENNSFKGTWLHDFNVKGVEEEDDYWLARKIEGEKLE